MLCYLPFSPVLYLQGYGGVGIDIPTSLWFSKCQGECSCANPQWCTVVCDLNVKWQSKGIEGLEEITVTSIDFDLNEAFHTRFGAMTRFMKFCF